MKKQKISFYIFSTMIIIIMIMIMITITILLLQLFCFFNNKCFHEILNPNDYNAIFNEEKYMPTQNIEQYNKVVDNGYKIMKTKKIVIGGLYQNSSNVFDKFKERMNSLKNLFEDVQIVIFENDSTDNSRLLLLNWEKEQNNVHIIKCEENNFCLLKQSSAIEHGSFSENRMKKMSRYRNIVKKYVDNNFNDYDYFMVIDTDARGGFSLNGLAYSFGINNNWDMISAYGSTGIVLTLGNLLYYDYIALINNISFDSNDYIVLINNLSFDIIEEMIKINSITHNDDLIPVNNAFGGLTIYKMSSIQNVDYTPHDNNYICEHTVFTNNMKMNGYNKFYINPKLIFLVGKQGPNYLFFY